MRFLTENATRLYRHTGSELDAPIYSVRAGRPPPPRHSLPRQLMALEKALLPRKQSPERAKVGSLVPSSKPIDQLRRSFSQSWGWHRGAGNAWQQYPKAGFYFFCAYHLYESNTNCTFKMIKWTQTTNHAAFSLLLALFCDPSSGFLSPSETIVRGQTAPCHEGAVLSAVGYLAAILASIHSLLSNTFLQLSLGIVKSPLKCKIIHALTGKSRHLRCHFASQMLPSWILFMDAIRFRCVLWRRATH